MNKDLDSLVLHVLEILHQERHQVLWEQKLSEVIWLHEVILIIVLDFFLHVVLETLWVSVHKFFKNQVNLHELTSWSSYKVFPRVMTIDIDKIGLKASDDLSLHDDLHINLILEFLEGLILSSLFSSLSTPLLS